GSVRGACVLMPNLLPQTSEAGFRAGGRGDYPLRRWPPEDWQPQGVDTPARRPCNAISARLAPGLVLAQHLGPTAPRPVDHPRPEFVVPLHLVARQQVLKVPGRVGRLLFLVHPAAARRMGETNALGPVEHQYIDVVAEQH